MRWLCQYWDTYVKFHLFFIEWWKELTNQLTSKYTYAQAAEVHINMHDTIYDAEQVVECKLIWTFSKVYKYRGHYFTVWIAFKLIVNFLGGLRSEPKRVKLIQIYFHSNLTKTSQRDTISIHNYYLWLKKKHDNLPRRWKFDSFLSNSTINLLAVWHKKVL